MYIERERGRSFLLHFVGFFVFAFFVVEKLQLLKMVIGSSKF
jgi:hypothetical protein